MSDFDDELTGIPMSKANRTMKMTDGYSDVGQVLTKEEQLRKDNPGLQELYDQYQTMLKLLMPAKPKNPQSNRPPKRKMMRR